MSVSGSNQVGTLTRALARGEEAAFRAFYDAYFDRLLRYLLVVTGGDETAAREALQLTLMRVARHVKTFDTEEAFWNWLTVLARSARADEAKKHRRWLAFRERFSRHAEITAAGNNGEADARLRAVLAKSVAALPPAERELIAQKYDARRSVREIAAAQATTEKAVESRLSRVRRKLKTAMLMELNDKK